MRPLPVSIAQTPLGRQARDWLVRHRRMVAWNDAVLINTAAGYRAFLAKFPDSDLAATARKLEERLRNRPEFAPAGCRRQRRRLPQNVALAGPTCPCNVQPPAQPQPKKVNAAGQARRAGSAEEAGRSQAAATRLEPDDDDVVVVRRPPPRVVYDDPPPRVYDAPPPPVGIGIGIGLASAGLAAAAAATMVAAGVDTEPVDRVIDPASVALRLRGQDAKSGSSVHFRRCHLLLPVSALRLPPGSIGAAIAAASRFSPLTQITPANVGNLVRAWEFRTGDLERRAPAVMKRTKFQATPLLVEDSLIFCSPFNEVIALDPGSGAQKWRYDPKICTEQRPANRYNCRGVAYWVDDKAAATAACRARIFMGTNDARVIALDAQIRHSLRRFRHQWRDQARDRHAAGMAGRIPDHVGAGG